MTSPETKGKAGAGDDSDEIGEGARYASDMFRTPGTFLFFFRAYTNIHLKVTYAYGQPHHRSLNHDDGDLLHQPPTPRRTGATSPNSSYYFSLFFLLYTNTVITILIEISNGAQDACRYVIFCYPHYYSNEYLGINFVPSSYLYRHQVHIQARTLRQWLAT